MSDIILITGSSRGFGKKLAETLLREGYIVYSGVRNTLLAPAGTKGLRLDLQDETTFQPAIDQVINEHGRIDAVIHNAGIAYYGGSDTLSIEEARSMFETNFFGPFRFTQMLLSILRQQMGGRILFISSIRGIESHAFMGLYSGSKAALESLAFDWAVTLAKWNIHVSVIEPGPMDTAIDMHYGTYYAEGENPYTPYPHFDVEWENPELSCAEIVNCLRFKKPPFRIQPTKAARQIVAKHLLDPSGEQYREEQEKLLYGAEKNPFIYSPGGSAL